MTTTVTTSAERPIFVATDARRARRLRYTAALAAAVACAWLVALAIGMLGVGRLPDLSLPLIARGADSTPAAQQGDATLAPTGATSVAAEKAARRLESSVAARNAAAKAVALQRTSGPAPTAKKKPHPAKPKTATPRTAPPSAATAAAVPTARQGWSRRGLTAPPGRTRQAEPKAKPAAAPGQTRRNATDTTTAPATPVTTPVPPGQQKKTDDPKQKV
jgi:hypothetical protein